MSDIPQPGNVDKAIGSPALFTEFREIARRLDELSYAMLKHEKIEALLGIIEELNAWGCRADKHEWVFDQCGYWQHQYCVHCRNDKYPDMAGRRCGELDAEMGRITEAQFLAANDRTEGCHE